MTNDSPDVSLIIPVHDEEACIAGVIDEAAQVLQEMGRSFEVLAINDGSTDGTAGILSGLKSQLSSLRVLTMNPNSGQSAAFGAGFENCHGRVVVLMDGDGQNDPHDIPKMLDALEDADVCCGIRVRRRDTLSKRWGSRLANGLRQSILHDGIRDTGCSLKAIKAEFTHELPMTLRGMHRFLPALLLLRGARIKQIPVNHRPRSAGRSKYTNFGRLKETVWDLWAVRWMQKRHRCYRVTEGN